MKNKIQKALLELGIAPNVRGFDYICRMVQIVKEDAKREKSICGIYEEIAKETNSTATSVERGIRHAISKANTNGDAWKKYVGIEDVKNSAFIYALSINITEE